MSYVSKWCLPFVLQFRVSSSADDGFGAVHDCESSNSTDDASRRRHCHPQLQPVRGRDLPDGVRCLLGGLQFLSSLLTVPALLLCESDHADVLMTDLATVHDRESCNSTDDAAGRGHCHPQLQPVRGRDLPDRVRC